jgi:SCY1-like protein 2
LTGNAYPGCYFTKANLSNRTLRTLSLREFGVEGEDTMFSKFVSSVSSGIHSNYDVQQHPNFRSGPWAVYDAQRRPSSTPRPAHQTQVSVFVFEKKPLEQSASLRGSGGSSKAKNEIVFTRLKKEVSMLSRLRHPCLLEVVEPVEETRSALTFVTERVISTLQSVVGGHDDGDGYSDSARGGSSTGQLDELEIQSGLSSLTKALQFLHESANVVHSNLSPQAIYVNAKVLSNNVSLTRKGDWKLGGFGFGISTKNEPGTDTGYEFPEYDSRLPRSVQRNLDFLGTLFLSFSDGSAGICNR